MKLLLTILLTLLLVACTGTGTASGGSTPAPDEGQARLLYVVNQSHLSTGEVQLGLAAVQRQLDEEFQQAYNVDAMLVLADPPEADSYRILLVDAYQGDSNAGYHDGIRTSWVTTPEGWTEILSHECIEMLVGNVCDPVQRPYSIPPGSPPVENFLLPNGIGFLESRRCCREPLLGRQNPSLQPCRASRSSMAALRAPLWDGGRKVADRLAARVSDVLMQRAASCRAGMFNSQDATTLGMVWCPIRGWTYPRGR